MSKVYVVDFEMFDGEDYTRFSDIFGNELDAKEYLQQLIGNYAEFWHDFDTTEKDPYHFTAFDAGWYDDAHINIDIYEKEIK